MKGISLPGCRGTATSIVPYASLSTNSFMREGHHGEALASFDSYREGAKILDMQHNGELIQGSPGKNMDHRYVMGIDSCS